MNQLNIYRKYKVTLGKNGIDVLLRALSWYLEACPSGDLSTLGNRHRVVKLGQRLQDKCYRLAMGDRSDCSIALNVSEAATLIEVLNLVLRGDLGALESSIIYDVYNQIKA